MASRRSFQPRRRRTCNVSVTNEQSGLRSQVSAVYQATLAASFIDAYNGGMYHYNPSTALEELTEEATLPNPVHVRDMMLRHQLTADEALELNRIFLEYQKFFGETQKLGKEILKRLAG